jgi:hypothetical protein
VQRVVVTESNKDRIIDLDVINFLMAGVQNEAKFASDVIRNDYAYSIERTASNDIVTLIETGSVNNIVVTGNVGNGKTTILQTVSHRLAARGINTFYASSIPDLLLREVSNFIAVDGLTVIVIDNFFSNRDVVRAIDSLGRADIFVITSARTNQFEFQESIVSDTFRKTYLRISVDELTAPEVKSLVIFLDRYGLWGKRQALPAAQKESYISYACSREIRTVILDVLKSPDLHNRIVAMISATGGKHSQNQLHSILIVSQLLNLANLRNDVMFVGEIIELDCTKEIVKWQKDIKDIAFFRSGKIVMKSAILSEYIIRNLIDTAVIVKTMIDAMRRLDLLFDNGRVYQEVFRMLCRYSFLEGAISEEKRRQHLVSYFEQIKELVHSRNNPLFWLQYAMCRLSLEQYPEAKRMFEVAYSISEKHGYHEDWHLDNQYARYLLESRARTDEFTDFMVAFNKAHTILVRQMRDEPRSYSPYRVAQNYKPFIERRRGALESGDLLSLVRACTEVLRFVDKSEIKEENALRECRREMLESTEIAKNALRAIGVDL